jgi:hypothetical protein
MFPDFTKLGLKPSLRREVTTPAFPLSFKGKDVNAAINTTYFEAINTT